MKIYISPSTQERNIGPNGYNEEIQMNLIADILIPELIRHEITVKRNDRTEPGVDPIVAESNAWGADWHIAIHSNACGAHDRRGCEVFCNRPELPTRPGTLMAHTLYDALTTIMPVKGRGVLNGNLSMSEVAHTTAPAALIEIDYHDIAGGADWIRANIKPLAQAILLGILKQIGIPYIPPVDYKVFYEKEVAKNAALTKHCSDSDKKIAELTTTNTQLKTIIASDHKTVSSAVAMLNGILQ